MASKLAKEILRILGDHVRDARVKPHPYMGRGHMWAGCLPTLMGSLLTGTRGEYVVVCSPLEQARAHAALEAAQRLWAERAPN